MISISYLNWKMCFDHEAILTNVVNDHEHLTLILRHEVMLTELGKNLRKKLTDNAALKFMTSTQAIPIVHFCLRSISVFAEFWRKSKPIPLLKHDKYFIMVTYRFAAALLRMIDNNNNNNNGEHSQFAEDLRLETTKAALEDDSGLAKQKMTDL